MKAKNIKHNTLTINDIEKQLYQFIIAKSKPYLSLPKILKKQSLLRTTITVKYLLPIINQNIVQAKPKQLIVQLLTDILQNSELSIQQTVQFFSHSNQQKSQFVYQIMNEVTLANILLKTISIPTYLLNFINDAKLNLITISISQIQQLKKHFYSSILSALQPLSIEQQLIVINRLMVLKQEEIVLDYFLKNNSNFIVQHFNHFSKQSNIVKNLYKRYVLQSQNEQRFIVKHLLISIANQYQNSTPFFTSLLNFNESFYYSGQKFKQFYYLLIPTHQNQPITKQILQWWAVSKQFIVTSLQAKVRCNILAMIIQNLSKQDLYANNYLISITEGIKKRLTDGSSKDFASLIWKMLAKKIEIKLTEQIQKADLFKIQQKPKEYHQQPQRKQIIKKTVESKSLDNESSQDQQLKATDKQKEGNQYTDIVQIEPKNIYDCILGLKNTHRKDKALKKLPELIKRHKQDLTLMWNTLLRQLLSPIKQQYTPILVELFSYKPQDFIESVVMFFMSRQNNISQKTYLIQIIKLGIQQLSTTQDSQQQQDTPFYFRKIKSTYFKQPQSVKQQSQRKQSRTRRWGHTRIAHQKANSKNVTINFVKKQQSINRFYPIANLLYFKIIDILTINPIQNLRAHQVYTHSLLKLIAIFVSNIKNHFDKYLILLDISLLCSKIIEELVQNIKKNTDRYEETGGLTLMLTLQILNKISLIIDQFIPQNVMKNIKISIQASKKLPNYGMSSVIDMIEANIYQRIYTISNDSFT